MKWSPPRIKTRVLTLDPGLRHTGFAFWDRMVYDIKVDAVAPSVTGVKRVNSSLPWEEAVADLCCWLAKLIETLPAAHVAIEFQEFWTGSSTSITSASKGDLFKLCYLTGGLGEVTRSNCPNDPVLVKPGQWKGQMGKKVVDRRIKLAINRTYKDHESDAVGIGLAIQGKL